MTVEGEALTAGRAHGATLVLEEPLSFWGGVDATTGQIIETRHPQCGRSIAGAVLLLTRGRGSSSSSSVLAECLRNGVGPAAIVLAEPDPILALGALVAQELYGVEMPVVVVGAEAYASCTQAADLLIETGADGRRGIVRTP